MMLFVSAAWAQVTPERPRVFINTTWDQPTGATLAAHNVAELKNALSAAQPGDTIVLDAGVTYTGNFMLPAKNNPSEQWIYIVSSELSKLPAAGHRVAPANAVNMPKIVTPNGSNAFTISSGGGYVRLAGIEMYSTSTVYANPTHKPWPINGFAYYLLQAKGASHVTVDRCYLHGSLSEDVNHAFGATAGSSYIAMVDSYVAEIHGSTNDSQAFVAFASPGPFKLVNNVLSASSEDVLFGGAGGYTNSVQPADIEIRNNHFWKNPAWEKFTSGAGPWKWSIKNNLECKSCQRIVVTGNYMENAWYGSDQQGSGIVITPRTKQSGWNAVDEDIDIENNTFRNQNYGFTIGGFDSNCIGCQYVGDTKRVLIKNNLILTRDASSVGGYHPLGFQVGRNIDSLQIEHNTVQGFNGSQPWNSIYFSLGGAATYPASTNVYILNNVFPTQVTGDGEYRGQMALETYMPLPAQDGDRFSGNVMYVPPSRKLNTTWPVHNYATTVPLTFQGDYKLATPMFTDTTDGALAGHR